MLRKFLGNIPLLQVLVTWVVILLDVSKDWRNFLKSTKKAEREVMMALGSLKTRGC